MSRHFIRSLVSAAVVATVVIALLPGDAFAQRGGGGGRGGQGSGGGAVGPPPAGGSGGGGRGGPGPGGPGPGGPGGGGRGQVVVVGGYGYPHGWYSPYYGYPYGWGWGFGWGWGYPYPFYAPWYGYPYYYDEFSASLKLQVTPKNAEVYVDGYLAGIVDDFDGTFQKLKIRPGSHEIVLWLDGYRTVQQQLHLASDSGRRIKFAMEPLAPGETSGPRPTPPPEPVEEPQPQRAPPPQQRQVEPPADPAQVPAQFGQLSIRVQPADAEILIDGEVWDNPSGTRLVVQLAPGRHKVEIRKQGFNTYSEEVLIRAGATMTLNVSLLRTAGEER